MNLNPSAHRPPLPHGLRRREWLLAALMPGLSRAEGALPQLNLLVELREAADAAAPGTGWDVRSADAAAARERPLRQLRVLNGASAKLRIELTRPLQVWQAPTGSPFPVSGSVLALAAPTTQWVASGLVLTARPRWPGGSAPVSVEVSAETSHFDPAVAPGSSESPQRSSAGFDVTLRVPIGQWVTLAASGTESDDANGVSSGQAVLPQALQLRVSLAP